jgi:hypothetical protein
MRKNAPALPGGDSIFLLAARRGRVGYRLTDSPSVFAAVSDVPSSRRRRICVSRGACHRAFLATKSAILRVFYIGTDIQEPSIGQSQVPFLKFRPIPPIT